MRVNVERMRRYQDRTVPRRLVVGDDEMMSDYDAAMERAQEWQRRTQRAFPGCEIVAWEDYANRQRVAERRPRP